MSVPAASVDGSVNVCVCIKVRNAAVSGSPHTRSTWRCVRLCLIIVSVDEPTLGDPVYPLHLPPHPPILVLLLLLILAQLAAIIHTRWKMLMDAGRPLGLPAGALSHTGRQNREEERSGASSSVVIDLCRVLNHCGWL